MPRRPRSSPRVFRILLQASDLAASKQFYEKLLAVRGRAVAPGRIYLDCGEVIVGLLDYSHAAPSERATPTEAVYFSTRALGQVYRRAKKLGCVDPGLIHNDPANPAGEIVVRPWGERSFYATDPAGNPICFVDARTLFTGSPKQVAALAGSRRRGTGVRANGGSPRSSKG
jgi:catechol 2,3-dioxygenase-like lactoylglutathione lyase family enzyme